MDECNFMTPNKDTIPKSTWNNYNDPFIGIKIKDSKYYQKKHNKTGKLLSPQQIRRKEKMDFLTESSDDNNDYFGSDAHREKSAT